MAVLDTLTLPDSVRGASITVTPFIVDSLNQRVIGAAVSYAVQSAANANTIPIVMAGVTKRLEISDTVFIEATDPVGISSLGYEVRSLAGALITADSVSSTGAFSTLVRTFRTRLPITTFPTVVTITGFARNANGRRDVTRYSSGAISFDTVAIVAGFTNPLPNGGKVADVLYFPRNDRLYLTNIERNQVEVYNLADLSFRSAINVGSRPAGHFRLAAQSRRHHGRYAPGGQLRRYEHQLRQPECGNHGSRSLPLSAPEHRGVQHHDREVEYHRRADDAAHGVRLQ